MNYTITPGSLCLTCNFIINSTEVGCQIDLQNEEGSIHHQLLRTGDIATGCVDNIGGLYDVYVYDIEQYNLLSSIPAIVIKEIQILSKIELLSSTILEDNGKFL